MDLYLLVRDPTTSGPKNRPFKKPLKNHLKPFKNHLKTIKKPLKNHLKIAKPLKNHLKNHLKTI